MKKIAIFIFVLFIPFFVFAQENSSDLENDLFGGDEDTLISADEARSGSKSNLKFKADLEKASLSLESKKLRIGGSLSSSMGINYAWVDPYSKKDDYLKSFFSASHSRKVYPVPLQFQKIHLDLCHRMI